MLKQTKNAEIIKYEKYTPGPKELLNLFNDLLDTISANKTLKSESQEDKTLMSSKDENEKKKENENKNENTSMLSKDENKNDNENEDHDETICQNETIRDLNDILDEIIDKSKSFEEQIKSLKKLKGLKGYLHSNDFDDKELKFKYFNLKLADMPNEIDEKLFEQIIGHKFETLANKLINTTNKLENQIIVKNINKNKDKRYEQQKGEFMIQRSDLCIDLKEAIDLILDFNEETI